MTLTKGKILIAVTVAVAAATGLAAVAAAQSTPKGWSYTIDKNGQRVPKSNRVTNADGSWREEVRQGNCVTVKEKTASGEYRESRQCDPKAGK